MLGSSILDAQRVEVGLRRRATVSIIRPPVVVMPGALATHGPTPPLGAAYVAAALRDAGFGVQLIDAAGEAIGHSVEVDSPVGPLQRIGLPLEAISDRIDPQASVVGISTMFLHEWPTVRELSAMIKQRPYPGSADFEKLVASGDHTIDEASYFVGLSRGSSRHRSWNPHVSARQLRLVQLAMIAGFYAVNWLRRPRRAARFLLGQVTGAEETYLDQMVRTKRRNLDPLGARRGRTARGRVSPDETPDASHEAASASPARSLAR